MDIRTKLIAVLGGIIGIALMCLASFGYGVHYEALKESKRTDTAIIKEAKDNAKVDKDLRTRNAPELDDTLSQWLRPE